MITYSNNQSVLSYDVLKKIRSKAWLSDYVEQID
jgi:hypothetical protein